VTIRINGQAVVWIILIAILFLVMWAIAPAFHWLWFDLFWMHPVLWILIGLGIVTIVFSLAKSNGQESDWGCLTLLLMAVFFVSGLAYVFLNGSLTSLYLIENIQPVKLASLPETTEIRYLPMPVAERFMDNKIQDPKHHRGDTDPIDIGEDIGWVAPRVPTGIINEIGDRTDGFILVKPDGQVSTINQPLKYGEGMLVTDNLAWPLWQVRYDVELSEFYYLLDKEEVLTIAPYLGYRFQFPVMVPYWRGVFVVHPDGRIEDLSPETAIADPRFKGQRLFPESLALKIADSWQYRNGIWNSWFVHNDQTEVPHIDGEKNQMPYLLPTTNGPVWFTGLEPFGPAYSIFKIILIDAHSGQISLYELPQESGMTGPNKASGYIRASMPDFQWYTSGAKESAGTMLAIEPKPFIKNNVLFWQVSITNIDYAGVRRTALVNAQDNSVIYFESLDEMKAYVAGTFPGRRVSSETIPTAMQPATGNLDLSKMSDKDLILLMRQILSELEKRN
jgi:hypothetical protein